MALAWLMLVVFVGFTVEAAAGFGATVITVTLAAQAFDIDTVLVALLPVNLLLSTSVVARHLREVDVRLLGTRILPLMGAGLAAGVLFARSAGDQRLKLVFAAFVVGLSALELVMMLRRNTEARALPVAAGAGALLAGGVIHGVFACGGPLVVYYAGRALPDKARFRATLSALWLVLNAVLLTTFAVGGKLSSDSLGMSGLLLAPLALGLVAGERLHRIVPERLFRRGVYVLLLGAGLALAYSTLK